MKIKDQVRVEIQQTLGHDVPDPNSPEFATFYSRLELEHPDLALRLAAALEDDTPPPDPDASPLFPEQAAQAQTRAHARNVMRRFFYRQDPYTDDWQLAKGKVGLVALGAVALLITPLLFTSTGGSANTTATPDRQATVADATPTEPAEPATAPAEPDVPPPPAPETTVAEPPPQTDLPADPTPEPIATVTPPVVPAQPAPAPAPLPEPTPVAVPYIPPPAPTPPPVALASVPAPSVPSSPEPPASSGGTIFRAESSAVRTSGANSIVLYRRDQEEPQGPSGSVRLQVSTPQVRASAAQQEVESTTSFPDVDVELPSSPATPATPDRLVEAPVNVTPPASTTAPAVPPVPSPAIPAASTATPAAAPVFFPGQMISARLETGTVVAENTPPMPIIARADNGTLFIGTVTLNQAKRLQIEFDQAVVNGTPVEIGAQAFDPDGYPGLGATTREIAPALAADLLRGSAAGVANYVTNLSQQRNVTILGNTTIISGGQTPGLATTVAGGIAQLFSAAPTEKALVRIAQVDRGTPLTVVILPTQPGR